MPRRNSALGDISRETKSKLMGEDLSDVVVSVMSISGSIVL